MASTRTRTSQVDGLRRPGSAGRARALRAGQALRTVLLLGLVTTLLLAACGPRVSEEERAAAVQGGGVELEQRREAETGTGVVTDAQPTDASEGARAPAGDEDDPGVEAEPRDDAGPEEETDASSSAPEAGEDATAAQSDEQLTAEEADQDSGTRSPVVIGHIGTYSGVVGQLLVTGRPMAQAWANYVNEDGGLNGHPVELIIEDDQGDPARGQALARRMVEEQGAIALMGNMTPISAEGYIDYLEDVGVPVIGGDLTQEVWHESPMAFPQGVSLRILVFGMVDMAVDRGLERIGLIYCAEVAGCRNSTGYFADGADRHEEADLVYEGQVALAQPNFTAECLEAQSNDVDVIAFAAPSDLAQRVMDDCAAQGYEPEYMSGGIAMDASVADSPHAEGFILNSMVFPWSETDADETRAYGEAIETYMPDARLGGASSHVWAAGRLLEAATEDLGPDPGPDDVLEGLYGLPDGFDIGGLGPPLTFARGEPATYEPCYFEMTVVDGQWIAPQGLETSCL